MSNPIEEIGETYQPKMKAMLEELRAEAVERGLTAHPLVDMTDEEYAWRLDLTPPNGEEDDGVSVTLSIAEAAVHGDAPGEDPESNGVNFSLIMVGDGGSIVGGLTPFNYTPDVWVPVTDHEGVAARWRIFDNACDPSYLLDEAIEHMTKRGAMGST